MLLLDTDGKVLENNGVELSQPTLAKIREALFLHKYLAEELSEKLTYLKLSVGPNVIITGFSSEGKILVISPESEAEEVEAISRFNA